MIATKLSGFYSTCSFVSSIPLILVLAAAAEPGWPPCLRITATLLICVPGLMALPSGLSLVICTLITIGSVNTTAQSASKDQVVMEILGQIVHVMLPAFSAARVFPTPLGGVVKSYWS